ncbi:hypothetical protein VPNG_06721 [Cytospora leucostoma]|uniref:BZIP domain-containing protein n=1 Tax=Cytospora leucostoma TaxID=1230097 RepID=A0A423WT02_9PEZI|nr:hypothetical protein VPNG_06721 [Cytospora leucostoma]
MASTDHGLSDFILTPQQQSLLFAALNSNKQAPARPALSNQHMSPPPFSESPVQKSDGNGFHESPFIDYDYDYNGDPSFDFAFADGSHPKMIGDLPESASSSKSGSDNNDTENPEKRSHPDEDDEEDGSDAKRQETGEKVPKKPGRKPLTTEPTSKRKAQNRAAQRAFRERKEQHLKNLETKVEELEKASASANHENSLLRAQVEKMTAELSEYKKRFSSMVNTRTPNLTGARPTFGSAAINNLNDVNFQFEFPKFGQLPGPPPSAPNGGSTNGRTSNSQSPRVTRSPSDGTNSSQKAARHGSNGSKSTKGMDTQTKEDLAKFSGIFSPPLTNNVVASASRTSTDSHNSGAPTLTSSPSTSSQSNGGANSSCGTSPEPYNQSPTGFRPVDTMVTIGEEKHQPSFASASQDYGHFTNPQASDLDFLASTSNFQFDPQLFGGYREPQENILGSGLDDTFFNDAFEMDFTTPYFAPSPVAHKKEGDDLLARIDAAKNEDSTELVQTNDGQLLTCNKIWEKLQDCPRVQSGDFDLDGLCSDLQKKAKCSGSGAVVDESTFKNVMQKYLGKTDEAAAAELSYCTGDFQMAKGATT